MDVNVVLYDMPCTIRSFARHNEDDSYTIVINARYDRQSQERMYRHEMRHITEGDFYKGGDVDRIEAPAHKMDVD